MKQNISVVGAGSWGTTIAMLLGWNGHNVNIWCRNNLVSDEINEKKTNSQYLKALHIPDNVTAHSSLKDSVEGADIIFVVVPSEFFRQAAKSLSPHIKEDAIVVSATKGIENGTYKRMSEILKEELSGVQIAALSGPNIAEEVARRIPTATVVASENQDCLPKIQKALESNYFKIYPLEDVVGVEICGALKNITAIATGVCDGLGLGDNARGSIITLGLTEINNFGKHFGAKQATCFGLAGVGDLVATCTSRKSRNRFVGEMIAKGKGFEEIKQEMHGMVAEGIKTCKAVYEFSVKNDINMPLTTQVYKVLYEDKILKKAVSDLIKLI